MTNAELSEIQRALGRIEGKQGQILEELERGATRLQELEQRHDKLNTKVNWHLGGLAAIVAVFVFFKGKITELLFG